MSRILNFPKANQRQPPAPLPAYHTSEALRWQILRDHKFVEDVNEWQTGERRLLEPVSIGVFEHHHRYQLNSRLQRRSWKNRGNMLASDEGVYCIGCRWRVNDSLTPRLLTIVPSITREQADAIIARGLAVVARRGQYGKKW